MERELLEAAARAAGYRLADHQDPEAQALWVFDGEKLINFAPQLDSSQALELAVKLEIPVCPYTSYVIAADQHADFEGRDRNEVVRRTIVRAAAAIGNKLEKGDGQA